MAFQSTNPAPPLHRYSAIGTGTRHAQMSQSVTVSLLITGHFPERIFTDWIAHRADLLDLAGWVKTTAPNKIEVQVTGHKVLVEALETACSLGPIDVDIDSVESQVSASQARYASGSCAQFEILN